MANSKPTKRRQNNMNPASLFLIGAGIILLGLAIYLRLPQASEPGVSIAASSGELPALQSVIPVKVDFPAPALRLTTLDNKVDTLENYLGQVVLINNWAIWCPPCKAELPHMEAYYRQHKDEGFTIIGIEAGDPAVPVKEYVGQAKLSFPIWLDRQQIALSTFNNQALPNSYVIDRSGQVRLAWTGPISQEMLEAYVTPLLSE